MELIDIRGIGKATLEKLKQLNINNVKDLLLFTPVSYIDMNNYVDMKSIEDGNYYLFTGVIKKLSSMSKGRRTNNFKAIVQSGGTNINVLWFNQPYIYDKLKVDLEYSFFGKVSIINNIITINNPIFENKGEEVKLKGILPIYKTFGLIHQANIRKYIFALLESIQLDSIIDKDSYNSAIISAHKPLTVEEGRNAIKLIAIEEIVNTIINYRINKTKFTINKGRSYNNTSIDKIIKSLKYELTPSQITAINEIIADMKSNLPMNRLLLGDVGSGKTIVSMIAMYVAAINGYQSLLLVPTTILARQHYNNSTILSELGLKVRMLNSDTTIEERKEIIKEVYNGSIDILIGTHSLLNEEIIFKNLGLNITDELHRFGVNQKSDIECKGIAVDTLVMSATPIPRALTLTLYDDLKVSRIDRRGDLLIKTNIVTKAKRDDMLEFLLQEVKSGRQGYIVCPRVEDIEGVEISSAKNLFNKLKKGVFKDIRIELLYGNQSAGQKAEIMRKYSGGLIDVLIATTVIEVGIDVPNASIMIIMNAERFGLAALHQLRGRVGRGSNQSYCFLYTEQGSIDRLNALKLYSNGADIADIDYDIRGGGDFIGLRQSGKCNNHKYKITRDMIIEGKKIADRLVIDDYLIDKFNMVKNDLTDTMVRKVTMN